MMKMKIFIHTVLVTVLFVCSVSTTHAQSGSEFSQTMADIAHELAEIQKGMRALYPEQKAGDPALLVAPAGDLDSAPAGFTDEIFESVVKYATESAGKLRLKLSGDPFVEVESFSIGITVPPELVLNFQFKKERQD